MSKIRIGIMGGGFILPAHAAAFAANASRCEVVAVAVAHPDRHRARIAELFGPGVRVESDYAAIARAPDVDAIDILLPHHLHEPAVLAAAAARKPVLLEKVMGRSVAECDRMIDACAKASVSLTVLHDRRYQGQWVAFKQIIDSGALGEIFYWKLEHNQNVELPRDHWVFKRETLGGGAIMSCLTHQIDMLRWCGGEIASVSAVARSIPSRMEGETVGVVIGNMASGAIAQLSINWFTRSNAAHDGLWYELIHACGAKGEAYYMSNRGTYLLRHSGADGKVAVGSASVEGFVQVPARLDAGHEGCITAWLAGLRGDASGVVTPGWDSRNTVAVAEAAYAAIASGRHTSVDLRGAPGPVPR